MLKGRFFLADKYNDRKAPAYWLKFQYPFWWTSLLTALDTLARMGFAGEDEDVRRGLDWFIANQAPDGCFCQAKREPFDGRKGNHFGYPACTLTIEKGTI